MSDSKARELLIKIRDSFLFTDDDGSIGVSDSIDTQLFSEICAMINDGPSEKLTMVAAVGQSAHGVHLSRHFSEWFSSHPEWARHTVETVNHVYESQFGLKHPEKS